MSSLWRPFSISEGPCQNVGFKGGCSQQQQHPLTSIPSSCFGNVSVNHTGAAAVCRSQDIYHSCSSKRTLAAAAVGGRKVTHPGKAILAGKLDNSRYVLLKCRSLYLPGVWDAYHIRHGNQLGSQPASQLAGTLRRRHRSCPCLPKSLLCSAMIENVWGCMFQVENPLRIYCEVVITSTLKG